MIAGRYDHGAFERRERAQNTLLGFGAYVSAVKEVAAYKEHIKSAVRHVSHHFQEDIPLVLPCRYSLCVRKSAKGAVEMKISRMKNFYHIDLLNKTESSTIIFYHIFSVLATADRKIVHIMKIE